MRILNLSQFLIEAQQAGFRFEADCVARDNIRQTVIGVMGCIGGENTHVIRLRFFEPDGELFAETHIPYCARTHIVGNRGVTHVDNRYILLNIIMQHMAESLYNWLCIETDRKALCN